MIKEMLEKSEKKVEYIELIYDLIFVYIIGRNNTLLHHIEGGFVERNMFIAYVLCTLAVIQIWTFTTYYINLYGRNGVRDHIFMFINMFLLYFIGEGTRYDWQDYHTQYHIAWALILINVGVQYIIEYRNHKGEPYHLRRIRSMAAILLSEAVIVLLSILEFSRLGTNFLSLAAVLFGICCVSIASKKSCSSMIDFPHLTERVMLYVVFTFGEMIIAIASYFEGKVDIESIYFSLMAFLIVVGLFLSYGRIYDHIINREQNSNGIGYILIHIFIIFFLNNITAALEFMREAEVSLLPKIAFITLSIIMYYVFLFSTRGYSKYKHKVSIKFYITLVVFAMIFAVLMMLLRTNMYINIALTVAFVFSVFGVMYYHSNKLEGKTAK